MAKLNELLSANSSQIDITSFSVTPGDVFKVFDNRTIPPKVKYHIVVGVSEERVLLGTVRINSTMNANVYRDQASQYRCIKIKADKYDFLDHDSTIDCNHLISHDLNGIKTYIVSHRDVVLGDITPDDLEDIKLRMLDAPTITEEDKEIFGIFPN